MKTLRKKWGLVDMKGRAFLVKKRANAETLQWASVEWMEKH